MMRRGSAVGGLSLTRSAYRGAGVGAPSASASTILTRSTPSACPVDDDGRTKTSAANARTRSRRPLINRVQVRFRFA